MSLVPRVLLTLFGKVEVLNPASSDWQWMCRDLAPQVAFENRQKQLSRRFLNLAFANLVLSV
jgi:hypothetical protein